MPHLRPWWPQTHYWSSLLPRTHVSRRSSAIIILRRWNFPSAPCATPHAKTGQGVKDGWPHKIFASDRVIDRKSVFQAHATELRDVALLSMFLNHLTSFPSLKRATHCMYAYRSNEKCQGHEKLACGQNDGGESGSGDRLSRLLELSNCENVVVVVSRWYGGTKLGSDRWKRISEVAKKALSKGGFMIKRENSQLPVAKKTRRK